LDIRKKIFLSHATPEDNDFSKWLAAKLILAGYHVWHDLDYLKGGDSFWSKIENVIRNETFRFIAIVSNNSFEKDGVRMEWNLAATVEKQIPGFIIPVRIDCFDFSRLPIIIHSKNVIDFNRGWHYGLTQLCDTLQECQAPQLENADLSLAKSWFIHEVEDPISWVDRTEILDSNWLPILSLPPAIETNKILSDARKIPITEANQVIPWFEYGEYISGFAPSWELINSFKDTVPLKFFNGIETENFLSHGATIGERYISAKDAKYRVEYLIRQAWDLAMEGAGLKAYSLASNRLIWYVPPGLLQKNKIAFIDVNGKTRRKNLVGQSDKYKVSWHYAIGAHVVLGEPRRIQLTAHIVFNDLETKAPLESLQRMHKLRRGFCKNWWNDEWRSFLKAFLTFISKNKSVIQLPVGNNRFVTLDASTLTFTSPRGLSDSHYFSSDETVHLDESDGEFVLDNDDASFIEEEEA
jgi:hypothetical protein